MIERTTGSGLAVVERGLPPRDNPPNANEAPLGTVGPNAEEGFGDTHVMYPQAFPPPQAQAWAGWPVGWAVPWNSPGEWLSRLDVIFACIDLNSSVLSTMPAYLVSAGVPQPAPPWLVNPEPQVYNSWDEFARQVFWSYQAIGEVFVVATARYADGFPQRFMMINPAFVNVEMDGGRRVYSIGGEELAPGELLHIRYASWPGDAHGHGPLEAAGARILAATVLARLGTEFAMKGGVPWSVIKHPRRLTAAQSADLQAQWVVARQSSIGAPAVLSGDLELQALSVNPKDAALAELQSMNESRLAVLLGVPPFLVGLPSGGDSLTYTSVQSLFDYHWRAGLRPKASAVMSALGNWALPRGTGIELNRDEYVRPGLGERATAYKTLVEIGALSAEEVRIMERLAPSPPPAEVAANALSDGSK